jgi:hypothetical protein
MEKHGQNPKLFPNLFQCGMKQIFVAVDCFTFFLLLLSRKAAIDLCQRLKRFAIQDWNRIWESAST